VDVTVPHGPPTIIGEAMPLSVIEPLAHANAPATEPPVPAASPETVSTPPRSMHAPTGMDVDSAHVLFPAPPSPPTSPPTQSASVYHTPALIAMRETAPPPPTSLDAAAEQPSVATGEEALAPPAAVLEGATLLVQ